MDGLHIDWSLLSTFTLHFPHVPSTQTCLRTWYQVCFQNIFEGKGAVPGSVALHTLVGCSPHSWKHFTARTLQYQRAFGAGTRYASLGAFWGILGAFLGNRGGTRVAPVDDRQITHPINVRLKHLLYDFWGVILGLLPVVSYIEGPKHPLKKSYSKCLKPAQIRWVIWRSSNLVQYLCETRKALHERHVWKTLIHEGLLRIPCCQVKAQAWKANERRAIALCRLYPSRAAALQLSFWSN